MTGILFTLVYMAGGIWITRCLLASTRPVARVWLGMTLGIMLEMELPFLSAFLFDFTLGAHLFSLLPLLALCAAAWFARSRKRACPWSKRETRLVLLLLVTALPLTLLSGHMQYTHNLCPAPDGSLHVGQSTYGDLNLHLGIITSMRNAKVPVDYSIFPGERLTYPFLTDSFSTTFMLFGASLQFAVVFPSILMMGLTYGGYIILAERICRKKSAAVLAFLFFFINGGLGFFYSLDMAGTANGTDGGNALQSVSGLWQRLEHMLNGWYQTPTNHEEFTTYNLRWSNVIADMLIPQRTTLGGWCQLIPCLYLLYDLVAGNRYDISPSAHGLRLKTEAKKCRRATLSRSLWPHKRISFSPAAYLRQHLRTAVLLGLWAGMLPLLHTHSFLALGLASAGLVLWEWVVSKKDKVSAFILLGTLAAEGLLMFLRFMPQITSVLDTELPSTAFDIPDTLFLLPIAIGMAAMLLCLVVYRDRQRLTRLLCLGIFGAVTVLLALPQLSFWTFKATSDSDHFLTLQFNWVNNSGSEGMRDTYLWFYIKNVGVPFLLLILALFEKNKKTRLLAFAAFAIFIPAECIRFQPNEYDNNKLFYVWYMLCAMIAADYAVALFGRLKGLRGRYVLATAMCVVFFSGGLISLHREWRSDYESFSPDEVKAARFIEANLPEHATFLTWTDHINPVSALTGRNIVCGPSLWLYWHGFNTWDREMDIITFFNDPSGRADLLEKYGVDYIFISNRERQNPYVAPNEEALDEYYELIYEDRGRMNIRIYRVPDPREVTP